MRIDPIEPAGWKAPRGYHNGMRVQGGAALVFVAGQIAWNAEQKLVGGNDCAAQFAQALRNVVAVVRAAGGVPEQIVSMSVYVTDKRLYLAQTREIGVAWREIVGRHYPAMALVEVQGLLEPGALVEIQATAALG